MSDPSPNLFIAFRSADTISEEDVRGFLEQFGPIESLSVPRRKEGESRLCFVTFMSEAKATEVMNTIIDAGMSIKGERPMVRYNNNPKENRRKTTGPVIGGGGGNSGFANGSGSNGIGFGQRREESKFGSQSSLNRSAVAAAAGGGGGDAHRPSSRSSGSSQFYANKDLDLSRLVIKVDTASGVRHIECQPDCFNLMKQFMTPDELDSGIRAYAIGGANRQQQQPSPLMPVPIHAEPTAPIRANGHPSYNGGGALSSSPQQQQQQQQQQAPAPPPTAQAAVAVSASPLALVSTESAGAAAPAIITAAAPVATPLTMQRFEPRRLAPGTRFQAKLIEFDSVSQFTVVDSSMADKYFQQIENLLNRLYNSAGQQPAGQPVSNPKPGDCVCSVWSNDNKYYRTVVREAIGGRLTVFFFDEASMDGVDASKVRTLSPELMELPNLALLCRLDGVPDSEFGRLRARLSEAQFAVELEIVHCNGFECSVRLYLNGQCLNQAASIVPATAVPAAAAPVAAATDAVSSASTSSLPRRSIEFNAEYAVIASEAASPNELGLMLSHCQADYQTVAAIFASINANNGSELAPLAAIPPVGSVCLAKWAVDNNFYRARVIQVDDSRCRLFFVDDGNTDTAGLDQLRQLPDSLKIAPPVAVRCLAANAANVRLAQPIDSGSEMLAKFADAPVPGVDGNFDAVLASLRFAANARDAFAPSGADAIVAPAAPSADKSDDACEVRIVLMNSPLDFFVQRTDRDTEFDRFGAELDAHCKQGAATCVPAELQVGSLIAAPYMGQYFRAKICELSASSSCALVFFIDYGNSDSVDYADLRKLDDAYANKPAWAKRCRLHRIAPVSNNGQWPDTIQIEVLNKLGRDAAVLRLVRGGGGGGDFIDCDLATENCPSLCQALASAGLASIVID